MREPQVDKWQSSHSQTQLKNGVSKVGLGGSYIPMFRVQTLSPQYRVSA